MSRADRGIRKSKTESRKSPPGPVVVPIRDDLARRHAQSLSEGDAQEKILALSVLPRYREEGLIPYYLKALADDDVTVRGMAAHALGKTGDRRATLALGRALADVSAVVRRYAVSALYRIRDPRALPAVVERLLDADLEVRQAAFTVLKMWSGRELAFGYDPGASHLERLRATTRWRDWAAQELARSSQAASGPK